MENLKERRKSPRVEVSIPVRYKELYGNSYLSTGTLTKNVSVGGVKFSADRFIALACRLLIEMRLPSIEKPIKTISKVAWIKKSPVGNLYEIGNHFLAMTKEDNAIISGYVKKAMLTQR